MGIQIIQKAPDAQFRESIWILPPHLQEKLPLTLWSTGTTLRDPNYHIVRRDGAKYYVLECIIRGEGQLTAAGHTIRPRAGDVYLLPKSIPNEYFSSRQDPWEKIWFNISGPLVDALIECYKLEGLVFVQEANLDDMFLDGQKIVRESRNNAPVELAAQLTRIFAAIANRRQNVFSKNPTNRLAQMMKAYLDEHWNDSYSLKDLSRICGKSPAQIMRVFHNVWNSTPKEYHTKIRFNAATRYLENTGEQIKAIADWLGFANEFQFSAWFKKNSGISPTQFRKGK